MRRHVRGPIARCCCPCLAGCLFRFDGPNRRYDAVWRTAFAIAIRDGSRWNRPHRNPVHVVLIGPVAREMNSEPDDAEEKIVSRVTAISPTAGTLTLELGGLVVSYGASTRFRTPVSSNVSRSTWESLINAELDAGRRPSIEARRNQPATPQAPSVTTFAAADLRVTDAISEAKIEVYVDADNLAEVTSPPPLAILTVFGLPGHIVSSTQIRRIVTGAPQPGANGSSRAG